MPTQYGYIRYIRVSTQEQHDDRQLIVLAETERTMIRQRQAEGIAAAKDRGKTWGKPKRQLDKKFFDALTAWKAGEITCAEAAESCGMTLSNFRYHAGKQA